MHPDLHHHDERPSRMAVSAIGAVLALTVVLVLIVYGILDLISADTERSAQLSSTGQWVNHLVDHTPDIDNLIATGTVTAGQEHGLEMAKSFRHVDGFVLFDLNGEVTFRSYEYFPAELFAEHGHDHDAHAHDTEDHAHGDHHDHEEESAHADHHAAHEKNGHLHAGLIVGENVPELARAAISSGIGNIEFKGVFDHNGTQERLLRAVHPVRTEDGQIVGAVSLITHARPNTQTLEAADWLSLLIPVVSAATFLVPMLVVLRQMKKARAKDALLSRMSLHDPLTGLLNRGGLATQTDRIFAQHRQNDDAIGILYVDFDAFKAINDTYGHLAGDACLRKVADCLMKIVGKSGFAGRMGGDEFVVLVPRTTRAALRDIASQILTAGRDPTSYDGNNIVGSLSIGMHLAPYGQDQDRAFACADMALYHAKENGRDQVVEYIESLDRANARSKHIEACLRKAQQANLLELHYQPVVRSLDGKVAGFEALLRLKDEDGNPIGPDEFIPVAERTGLIHQIGIWTLETALETAKTWDDALYVSVNLSAVQFQAPDLADRIEETIRKSGVPPQRLELELTESLLLSDEAGVSMMLERLQAYGVSVAMDDFGTGYSSLGYLWKYNFDKIKIDRSFLQGLNFDQSRYRDIVETIVLLGHKLGMTVTVEGVETARQTEVLSAMRCDQFQGFYFARPMPAADIGAALAKLGPKQDTDVRKAG